MIRIVDTETTGLKHSHGDRAFAVGYTDDNEEVHAVYTHDSDLLDVVLDGDWCGHNIGFDLPMLADLRFFPKGELHDTMIMAHIFNNIEPHKDLASLALKYCGISNDEDVALDQWFIDHGYNEDNRKYIDVPEEIITPYLKADIRRTLALYKFYKSKGVLDDPAYKLEMELVPIVAKIQARGMCVDVQFAKDEFSKATTLLAAMEERALNEFGVENIASNQQIADALFTRGGLTCVTFTIKGNIQLDETSIQKYDHPLVDLVLSYRQLSKLTNTYLKAIIEKSYNGRLHSSLKQVGARTGRFSSSDPNLQNIPRNDEHSPINLRRAFICSEGSKLLLVDLSQIELRILAHYSKEPLMIETLKDRKGDLHKATAIAMFGEVNDELRTVAKTINFGTIYGAGGQALQQQINKALPHKKVSLAQAKDFRAKYFKGFPYVQQFIWDVQNRIAQRGYVQGKSGRKYYCPRDTAYVATNYLIQGESAMLMKCMMIDVEAYLHSRKSQLINIIHDEFIIELTNQDYIKSEGTIVLDILDKIEMPEGMWRVPIYANAAISDTTWSEKRKVNLADHTSQAAASLAGQPQQC